MCSFNSASVVICCLVCCITIVNILLRCLDIVVHKFMFSTTLSDNGYGGKAKGQNFPQVSELESREYFVCCCFTGSLH